MPAGNIPGWRQIFLDDFTVNAPLGSWGTGQPDKVVYTGDHGGRWAEYPDGWPCTSHPNCYQPSNVLSVHDGVLDFWLHNYNGSPAGANPSPILGARTRYRTYGRYEARFKVVYDDSLHLDQYHIAWLLWPRRNGKARYAESDFPEANLNQTSVCGFSHYGRGLQRSFCTPIDFTQWHIYTQEWGPGYRSYWLDGIHIGTSADQVYNRPERWQLQTEARPKGDSTSGHLLVDWVSVYAPA